MARLARDETAAAHGSGLAAEEALALRAEGLTKRYGSTIGVLDIDLSVPRGERFGFLGPNGAGKTTFIRLALGLLRPTAGRISLMGVDMAAKRLAAAPEIGYLPGELGLIPNVSGRTTLDSLAALHPRPPELRSELLKVLSFDEGDLDRNVREYSRGMKQKLGLIAALQHDPPLIILDEPTGGLDPVVQEKLIAWLRRRSDLGRTLFFSSHVLSEVEELCQRVGMIRDGRLIEVVEVETLRRSGGRVCTLIFEREVEPRHYLVEGIEGLEIDDRRHRFRIHGSPAPLLARLIELPLEDITIEPPRLEDLFRSTYTGEGPR
ncbi:MAG: ABC transporter ATP-binding protein [Thermoleophilia bacterium]|nr:ABC transporter ATP-binding protein [Thermoleophilia bacterium]